MLSALTYLAPPMLAVQAGGGGSFGGGGGGGFGGGGFSGGGGGDSLGWLIALLIHHPVIGVPVLLVLIVLFMAGGKRGWTQHQSRTIRRAHLDRSGPARKDAARVLAADASFDEGVFLARVEQAFHKAQDAWCRQDLEPLRPFVSDGVYERFSLQVEGQKVDGWRQGMQGTRVGALEVLHVAAGPPFDTITVRVPFESDINRLSLETGKPIAGSRLSRDAFVECWTFVRRTGATSITGAGLIEGQCPNCGARLEMNRSARCGHCDCLARNGEFDWVLTEITQASVWAPEGEGRVPGLVAYRQRDPGMNAPMLEDAASVAFWRRIEAERTGSIEHLSCVATDACVEAQAGLIAAGSPERHVYLDDCAVGSVRTLGVLAGDERDRAVVEMVWDGATWMRGPGGRQRVSATRGMRRELYVFTRRAGRTTDLGSAFATTFCSNCMAHDDGGLEPTCRYCGAPRRGDRSTWLLDEIQNPHTRAGADLQAEIARLGTPSPAGDDPAPNPFAVSEVSSSGLVVWAAAAARADGLVSDREREAVLDLAERAGVPESHVREVLESEDVEPNFRQPRDPDEARAWLLTLVRLSLVDGSLSQYERAFLRQAAEHVGLSAADVKAAETEMRRRLYREARAG